MRLAAVDVDCPKCKRPLPPVPVVASVGRTVEDGAAVEVELRADISEAYYKQVRLGHPWCFGSKDDPPEELVA